MKVITFSQKVTVNTVHGQHSVAVTCNPGERLLFDDDNAFSIQQNPASNTYVLEVSDLGPMLKEVQRPLHWRKRRVLFYRNRGSGDQLIASALSRFFREVLGADARQLSDRVHEQLWAFNPNIANAPLSAPLHLDAVWRRYGRPFFDQAFFIESATEWENDGEQPNVYDRLFALAGFDPDKVAAKFKRPVFNVSPEDIERRNTWLKSMIRPSGSLSGTNLAFENGYIFVQLRAANKVRSLPLPTAQRILAAVSDVAAKKSLYAFIADDQPLSQELAALCKYPVFNVAGKIDNIRLYGSLIAGARVAVGPDSSALHFAAANETPALGIWGPFDPASRCKYYPNQTHLWHKELCVNSPCFNFLPELPTHKCPRGQQQPHCECYDGITHDEIYSALLDRMQ